MLHDFLARVPSSLWSALATATVALLVVALTNNANSQRMRAQFAHERALRNQDRDMALRKDVYLSVAEAAQTGLLTLGKYANLNIPLPGLENNFIEKASSVAKLYLMANESTSSAVSAAMRELTLSMLDLALLRIPIDAMTQQISQIDSQIAGFGRARDRWLEAMQQFNLEGAVNAPKWDILQRNFDFQQEMISKQLKERESISNGLRISQLKLLQACLAHQYRINGALVTSMVKMRTELSVTTDVEVFESLFSEAIAQQHSAIEARLSKAVAQTSPGEPSEQAE